MKNSINKTKIIFTIGPVTQDEATLERLIRAGVDICRINMAHADHAWIREIIRRIRKVCHKVGRQIALLMDIKGPEIRTGDVHEPFELQKDELVDFTCGEGISTVSEDGIRRIDVNYPSFPKDVKENDTILVDSGLIRLEVLQIKDTHVRCKVLIPGRMSNRRHINLPGVRVNLPALTKKDQQDVDVGIAEGVDFFALSFVREAKDLEEFHNYLEESNCKAKIIAKIEDQQAITNIKDIIRASDGLMVARGDLGVEFPFEELPIIQTDAVNCCIQDTKPVIVATHMLESMIESPIPTRAEVTDVANAIREQADCVMLSGETTVGKYPVECVETIQRIAKRIEESEAQVLRKDIELRVPRSKMLRSAAYLAHDLGGALVVFTRRGIFAQKLSSLRPGVPIYAFTDNPLLFKHLLIMRGVNPFLMDFDHDHETTIQNAFKRLKRGSWCEEGDSIVVITKMYADNRLIDSTQIRSIE